MVIFFPYGSNAIQTLREARASHLAMMWYGFLLFVPFSVCFHSFPVLCTYAFYDVQPLAFLFLLQVEVPHRTTNGILVKEAITTPSIVLLGVEEELLNGGVTKEVEQPIQDVQPILSSVPLAI